ncbi:MAG: hypothetical protein OSB44_05460 [Verrucomicrobiales bacterium]|nr:hypothetical protein [Verrucomicrobiales bacterium]
MKKDRFHVSAFARLLERMDQIKEVNGTTLLDNTIFTLGAGMGDRKWQRKPADNKYI